ncbi:MAG: hypothetical protein AB4911_13340 [Oscillochloridaceae bacterium umkhey_bin13]
MRDGIVGAGRDRRGRTGSPGSDGIAWRAMGSSGSHGITRRATDNRMAEPEPLWYLARHGQR